MYNVYCRFSFFPLHRKCYATYQTLQLLQQMLVGLQPNRQPNQSGDNSHRTSIENSWTIASDSAVLATSRIKDKASNGCTLNKQSAMQTQLGDIQGPKSNRNISNSQADILQPSQ